MTSIKCKKCKGFIGMHYVGCPSENYRSIMKKYKIFMAGTDRLISDKKALECVWKFITSKERRNPDETVWDVIESIKIIIKDNIKRRK